MVDRVWTSCNTTEEQVGEVLGGLAFIQAGNEPKSEWTKACVCVSNKRE